MSLSRPCPGRRVRGPRKAANQGGRNGLLQQLTNLKKGLHPKTRRLLPPAVPIDPHAEVPPEMTANCSSQEGRRYELATPATLNVSLQAMLARVRKRALDRNAETPVVKRRIMMKSSPGASTSLLDALLTVESSSGSSGN